MSPSAHVAAAGAAVRRPWLPHSLRALGLRESTVDRLSYLVLEEMVDEVTTLTVAAWPAADAYGRLRFATTGVHEVTVLTDDLNAQLYDGWLPRRARIGDVFASDVDRDVLRQASWAVWREPLVRLLPDVVYDLSGEGRTAAKLALYGARTDLLSEDDVDRNDLRGTEVVSGAEAPHRRLGESPADARE